MEKGDTVQHKVTNRLGKVHSFSKKHPGWVKVLWDGEDEPFRYEEEDLVVGNQVDWNVLESEFEEINRKLNPARVKEIENEIREQIKKSREWHPKVIK